MICFYDYLVKVKKYSKEDAMIAEVFYELGLTMPEEVRKDYRDYLKEVSNSCMS